MLNNASVISILFKIGLYLGMAMRKHTGIKIQLHDITATFLEEMKPRIIFGGYHPKPVQSRRGKFLSFEMPDSTTILISHN